MCVSVRQQSHETTRYKYSNVNKNSKMRWWFHLMLLLFGLLIIILCIEFQPKKKSES